MQKKTKTGLIIAVVVALIVVAPFCAYHIYKSTITARTVDYLCEKYSAQNDAFEVVDCNVSHYYLNDDAIPQLKKSENMWEIKYNNRLFFVRQTEGRFVDDYQLEDIEKWSVDYLQKNIDKNIVGFDISSLQLYAYLLTEYPSDPMHLITADETEQFLSSKSIYYYYNSDERCYHSMYVNNYETYAPDSTINIGSQDYTERFIEDASGHDFSFYCFDWNRSYS